ncbi:MAG: DUF4334 domain-containing protein [Pseudomonadota bacterium]|nr:DUF4334 domain-containing protein [Pseudomonadota bacterium]
MNAVEAGKVEKLTALEAGTTAEAAMTFFDSLQPVELGTMIGSWRGSGLPTGHPLDGLLERVNWHGKRFDSPEDVHPLIFSGGGTQLYSVNPARVPMGLIASHPGLFNSRLAACLFPMLRGLLRTRKPAARLRMTEYRGVTSATMLYDALPINDIFRKIDDDTLLCLMDMRGAQAPFFFVLRRETGVDRAARD